TSPTNLIGTQSGTPLMSPPPPKPAEPFRIGGDIKPPARIFYQPPVYPTIAQTARVEGIVVLEATIDESGIIRDLRVVRSIPLLDRAALDAVSKWRYTPTRLNGAPVAVIMTVTVPFTLRGSPPDPRVHDVVENRPERVGDPDGKAHLVAALQLAQTQQDFLGIG